MATEAILDYVFFVKYNVMTACGTPDLAYLPNFVRIRAKRYERKTKFKMVTAAILNLRPVSMLVNRPTSANGCLHSCNCHTVCVYQSAADAVEFQQLMVCR